jgi:propanol-preferring alcohol dehydrogenase
MVVGRVDAIGAGVTGFQPGDRAGIAWLQGTCGACEFCAEGRENLCEHPRFTGYQVQGGYAELCVTSAAWAYRIPEIFSDAEATPLLCAGIIGYRALRLTGVRPGQRLGIYGFGNSAHVTIQVARHWGCEIFVCSLRPEHQALARELGAAWVGGAAEAPPAPLHGAIMFAPAGELVPGALRALRPGGTLACAGIHMTPIPGIDYDSDLFRERVLRSVTANTRQDGLDLLREAAAIPIRTHTRDYPLAEANRALRDLKAGRIRGAAVLQIS